MLPGTGQILPIVTLMCSLPLQRDIPHNFIIYLTIQPSVTPLITSLNPAASIKWIYQMCGYLRGKGDSKSFSKPASGKRKEDQAIAPTQEKQVEHSYYIFYTPGFQALSKQVNFQPALYTSPNTCFLRVRIHLSSVRSYLLPSVAPAAFYCSSSSPPPS